MKIFITGATGTLGRKLIAPLVALGHEVHILVRPDSYALANQLFGEMKIKIWAGDLTHPDILINGETLPKLTSEIEVIIHMAALYNLAADRSSSYLANVVGTQGMLYFASLCPRLISFLHVSTIAVAGDFEGEFKESFLDQGQSFDNNYARTKYEAELLVKNWKMKAHKIIVRPGIIVGDSKTGVFDRVDGPYFFLEALSKISDKKFLLETLKYLPMPFKRKSIIPLVPIDFVSQAIKHIALNPSPQPFSCYHLVNSANATVEELLQDSFKTFDFKVQVIPLPESKMNDLLMEKIGLPKELLSYLYSLARFSNNELLKDYPELWIPSYYQFKNIFFNEAKNYFSKKRTNIKKSKILKKNNDFISSELQ